MDVVNIVEYQDMGDVIVFAVLSKQSENPGANDADCAAEILADAFQQRH